jgi:tetratricopeptide (TPR) repeat protein
MVPLRALLVALLLAGVAMAADGALARARKALDAGKLEEAVAIASSALEASPDDAQLLAVRGRARLYLGGTIEARADIEKAASRGKKGEKGLRALLEALEGNDERALELTKSLSETNEDRIVVDLLAHGVLDGVAHVCTEHYSVFGTVYTALRAAGILERSRRAYEELLPPRPTRLVARVFLFPTKADFRSFANYVHEEVESDDAEGFSRSRHAFIAVHSGNKLKGEALGALVHEGLHMYVHAQAHSLPVWLDEGLAEYFGAVREEKGELSFGNRSEDRHNDFKTILAAMKPLPLGDFVKLDEDSFHEESRLPVNYAQAWAFAHFLIEKRPALLRDYWRLMQEGRSTAEARAATFDREDAQALERAWRDFMKSL